MRRDRFTLLALSVFGLTLASFLIRGFGQFAVSPRTATLLAAPTFLLALAVLAFVLGYWLLSLVGITRIEG